MRMATRRRKKRIWIKYRRPSRSGSGRRPLTLMQVLMMRVRTSQRRKRRLLQVQVQSPERENTSIWALNLVETPFCHSFSQICYTRVFASTNSTGLSDLLSARGLAHSHRITDLFVVYFSARGLVHCTCQLPHSLAHLARCCFPSVGVYICSPPHNNIQFPFQLVYGVCLLVNEGIQHAVTK